MHRHSLIAVLGISGMLLLPSPAFADRGSDLVAMAATGRFDQLETTLEAAQATEKLNTKDLHSLCYAYSKTKRYAKLLQCLDRLEKSIASGDRRSRLFGLDDATPSLGIMKANALIEMGRYAEAVDVAKRNVDWLRADGSTDQDMYFESFAAQSIASTLGGQAQEGLLLADQLEAVPIGLLSDFANAKAMALARARMALEDYPGVIRALNSDKTFSLNVFLDRLVSGGFFTGVNNWLWAELPRAYMLNKALLETGQVPAATAGFDKLLALPQIAENGDIYWLLQFDRGRIHEEAGQVEEALACYQKALEVIENQRASINTEASKIGFVGDKQKVYAAAVRAALRLNRKELAYDFVERSKSRALVDLLASREKIFASLATNTKNSVLLDDLLKAQTEAALQLPQDMAVAGQRGMRSLVVKKARALQQAAPELASIVTVTTIPVGEVRKLLQPNEVLVEYFGHGKEFVAIAISAQGIAAAKLDSGMLDQDVRGFRTAIAGRQPEAGQYARKLYAKLLQPLAPFIDGKNLVIVPHGILHYLPFAALHDGNDYLLAAHSLRYLPSASAQKFLRPAQRHDLGNMLILGNPDVGRQDLDLPKAEEEARMIHAMASGSRLLTRKDASKSNLKALAGDFHLLHIASHGQFKPDEALQSRLLLAPGKENDGSLTVDEIYTLNLHADLVTLSACETGLGKTLTGDDIVGLTRGFMYAGSSNIVASHWEVDDEATSVLMRAFYQKLKAGLDKKEALRAAQLETRKKFAEPIFWSAFYLTGQGV